MRRGRVLLWLGLCAAALAGAAHAGQALEFTDQAGCPAECRAVPAEFGWACAEFETPQWVRVYGRSFWQNGAISVLRHDLDGDGMDDLIVRVEHTGHCGSAGCENRFYFGDLSLPENFHPFTVHSLEAATLIERNGERFVAFGEAGHLFPVYVLKTVTRISPWLGAGGSTGRGES